MRDLKRNEEITVAEWQRMPWLLPRSVACSVTGLSTDELSEEVRAGRLHVYRNSETGYGKFFKSELAALCRLPEAEGETLAAIRNDLASLKQRLAEVAEVLAQIGRNWPELAGIGRHPIATGAGIIPNDRANAPKQTRAESRR